MKIIRIEEMITEEDVDIFNEIPPDIIEISSLKGQKSEVIAKLNPKIKLRIREELDEKEEKTEKDFSLEKESETYSPEELSAIVSVYETIEKGINAGFDDIDAALYIYVSLIKKISPVNSKEKGITSEIAHRNSLDAILSSKAFPKEYALIYKHAMERLGISCKIYENEYEYAWNEILIDGAYYPVDLAYDAEDYRAKETEDKISISKFLSDKEFYSDPIHDTVELSDEEKKEKSALEEKKVLASYEKVTDAELKRKTIEKPVINIKSKELARIFDGERISQENISRVEELKISVSETDTEVLSEDLAQIGKYYPELLNVVQLENTSSTPVKMQRLVDAIYESRQNAISSGYEVEPVEIIISSANEEDFDLDFSKAPEIPEVSNSPTESERKTRVVLKNTSSSAIKIPNLNGKLNKNIDILDLTDFDLNGLDLTGSGIAGIALRGANTVNADNITGIDEVSNIALEALDTATFNSIYSRTISNTSDVHDIKIKSIDLSNRKILEELSNNPNLARIEITSCNVNDIDGLENFNGRIALLNLNNNNLNVDDIGRLCRFAKQNRYLDLYMKDNSGVINTISTSRELSDLSYNHIKDWFKLSKDYNVSSKSDAPQWLLWGHPYVPYYINDAELVAGTLKNTLNPVMLEKDDDIDTINFSEPYLQEVPLLLTITQLERLISSGKTIPQNVRLQIHDVTELTADRARNLAQDMANRGMNLTGIQIFDKQVSNSKTNTNPYSIAEYIYIRETLDKVVAGIDMSEPDIDKFATIYDRLGSKITYDYGATNHRDFDESMYYAEKLYSSRNLLEGLQDETCVCAGYADILRNALLLVGIDARYNSGRCDANDTSTGHAWNQVLLDDGTGNKKWYYTDLTWDAGNNEYNWTLLGDENFKSHAYRDSVGLRFSHDITYTQNRESCTREDYDRLLLREAFARARARNAGYDYMQDNIIHIPEDPITTAEILDQNRIATEYKRRKNDMYAKFYGDRNYEVEYAERNRRYREHEIEKTENNITFRTIEDYPEREKDEEFLLLDKYKECLERISKYESGDTSVYRGTIDQIRDALERDREYVETRNHTFNQHRNTQKDLATLGKYGEKMPYIPKQPGAIRNLLRAVGNTGIFVRNLVSPIYRGIGRYIAQPLHRLIINGKDASPYRNNWYHRMVARREYFGEVNSNQNPGHPIINAIKSRVDAFTKVTQGNEAVLRAGAADIRDNIISQEREKALIQNLTLRSSSFDAQIQQLEQEVLNKPNASNINAVRTAIQNKIAEKDRINNLIESVRNNGHATEQTDAVSDKQHAIASKEVNTMRVTAIKGVAKGIAVKYIGPKIHEWLLARGKTTRTIEITTEVPETRKRWVETTYKDEVVPLYEDAIDTSKNMSDIIGSNEGKSITGFYTVYGGETGAATYKLAGNEKITAIFQADGLGGSGLSDTAYLKAPVFTDGTFSSELLDAKGFLNQDVTLGQVIEALNTKNIDMKSFSDVYVSIGDRYWTKLSDLVKDLTTQVQVGEEIKQVVDVAGHYEDYTEMVEKIIKTTEVITNPAIERTANIGSKLGRTAVDMDGIFDIFENVRKTTTDEKSNKRNPRRYDFDEEVDDIPKSKKDYRKKEKKENVNNW